MRGASSPKRLGAFARIPRGRVWEGPRSRPPRTLAKGTVRRPEQEVHPAAVGGTLYGYERGHGGTKGQDDRRKYKAKPGSFSSATVEGKRSGQTLTDDVRPGSNTLGGSTQP